MGTQPLHRLRAIAHRAIHVSLSRLMSTVGTSAPTCWSPHMPTLAHPIPICRQVPCQGMVGVVSKQLSHPSRHQRVSMWVGCAGSIVGHRSIGRLPVLDADRAPDPAQHCEADAVNDRPLLARSLASVLGAASSSTTASAVRRAGSTKGPYPIRSGAGEKGDPGP